MATLSLEFLGTAGAIRTPRPGCNCRLCVQARRVGIPWERGGPSVFVHGPNVLIDTPEESAMQVNRAGIGPIAAGFYSHWHPDHTAGRRMWETRNWDFRNWPSNHICTPIYLPPNVVRDFGVFMGLKENFDYWQAMGLVDVRLMDGPVSLGGWRITAHPVHEEYVYAFLFEEEEEAEDTGPRRVLIAMDELYGWSPPAEFVGVDLAVLPTGIFEFNPFTGERRMSADHPVLEREATWRQTVEMVGQLQAKRVIFAHIEEPDGNSPEELLLLADELRRARGWNVTFAYDTLVVEL